MHLNDNCVFIWREGGAWLIIGTHVDDIFPLFNPQGKTLRNRVLAALREKMEVDDKGTVSFALDTRVQKDEKMGILKLSQKQYIDDLLSEYNITSVRTSPAPVDDLKEDVGEDVKNEGEKDPVRTLVGRLYWLADTTRPDIYCSVHKCSVLQNKPSKNLWKRAIHILEYLNGTREVGIVFRRPEGFPTDFVLPENVFEVFCDASFANDVGYRSRMGYFFFFLGGLVSWCSKLTERIMSSSTEAE